MRVKLNFTEKGKFFGRVEKRIYLVISLELLFFSGFIIVSWEIGKRGKKMKF